MEHIEIGKLMNREKYDGQAIRWLDKEDHYELVFTDDFVMPASSRAFRQGPIAGFGPGSALLTDILLDMRAGYKDKEVHVFVGSFGGEVAALNMILQELLTYEYRVGVNLGTACSCGWMLLFACQERYVSPYSQAMYHDISTVCAGKHAELRQNAEFMGRWQEELLKITDTAKVLTEKELEMGRTTDVWFTGRDLIERGAARDYREYADRRIPMPIPVAHVGGQFFLPSPTGWIRLAPVKEEKPLTYAELVKLANTPPELPPELMDQIKAAGNGEAGPSARLKAAEKAANPRGTAAHAARTNIAPKKAE